MFPYYVFQEVQSDFVQFIGKYRKNKIGSLWSAIDEVENPSAEFISSLRLLPPLQHRQYSYADIRQWSITSLLSPSYFTLLVFLKSKQDFIFWWFSVLIC